MADFDIKKIASELVDTIKDDPQLLKEFKKDPVATLESLAGGKLPAGLPKESIQAVATAIQAKLASGDIANALGGLGKLF